MNAHFTAEDTNYARVEKAIAFIRSRFKERPDLESIAAHVGLSAFHFQKVFLDWAGISPKEFLQYTGLEYAKRRIREKNHSLFESALDTGLSGSGRLHDLFIKLVAMRPGEYRNGGKDLRIQYDFGYTPFGEIGIASTETGICKLLFIQNKDVFVRSLQLEYPEAEITHSFNEKHRDALNVFDFKNKSITEIKLHVKASPFRIKVWEALLQIPEGELRSYGQLAETVSDKKAARAVGTAIASNPIAYLIPCHRVILGNGESGNYMWGENRKIALIAMEASVSKT